MSIKLQLPTVTDLRPRLTVIGVGGAGCNAVNNMIAAGLTGVEFVVANTDAQALAASSAEHRLQLGTNLTEGLGAGAKPEVGEAAAEEAVDEIRAQISGSHMVFLAAGMGGGTGTGAASVIAKVSREMGILTVGVVTKPFLFEGSRRMRIAEAGIEQLRSCVDTLIVIPNQNLFRIANEKTTFAEAFVLADQVLYSGVACIVDLIIKEGLINLDFADVRAVMSGMGTAMMGTGEAEGERRAVLAAEEAISNPLLDEVSLKGAKGLLLSITGGPELTLYEVDEAASRVRQEVDPEANIIVGATFDDTLSDRVRVSIVASGMTRNSGTAPAPGASQGGGPDFNRMAGGSSQGARQGTAPADAVAAGAAQPNGPLPGSLLGPSPERNPKKQDPGYAPGAGPGAGDLERRLGQAMQGGADNSDDDYSNQHDEGPEAARSGGPRTAAAKFEAGTGHGETWNAPGDVLIEEGKPNLAPPVVPGGASGNIPPAGPPSRSLPPSELEGFQPMPPADVRRSARRVPEVDEFPEFAQREYHAKTAGHRDDYDGQDDGHDDHTPERKPGLFERWTGFGRKQGDSRHNAHESHSREQSRQRMAPRDERTQARGRAGEDVEQDTYSSQEAAELPVFFDRGRR